MEAGDDNGTREYQYRAVRSSDFKAKNSNSPGSQHAPSEFSAEGAPEEFTGDHQSYTQVRDGLPVQQNNFPFTYRQGEQAVNEVPNFGSQHEQAKHLIDTLKRYQQMEIDKLANDWIARFRESAITRSFLGVQFSTYFKAHADAMDELSQVIDNHHSDKNLYKRMWLSSYAPLRNAMNKAIKKIDKANQRLQRNLRSGATIANLTQVSADLKTIHEKHKLELEGFRDRTVEIAEAKLKTKTFDRDSTTYFVRTRRDPWHRYYYDPYWGCDPCFGPCYYRHCGLYYHPFLYNYLMARAIVDLTYLGVWGGIRATQGLFHLASGVGHGAGNSFSGGSSSSSSDLGGILIALAFLLLMIAAVGLFMVGAYFCIENVMNLVFGVQIMSSLFKLAAAASVAFLGAYLVTITFTSYIPALTLTVGAMFGLGAGLLLAEAMFWLVGKFQDQNTITNEQIDALGMFGVDSYEARSALKGMLNDFSLWTRPFVRPLIKSRLRRMNYGIDSDSGVVSAVYERVFGKKPRIVAPTESTSVVWIPGPSTSDIGYPSQFDQPSPADTLQQCQQYPQGSQPQ